MLSAQIKSDALGRESFAGQDGGQAAEAVRGGGRPGEPVGPAGREAANDELTWDGT